MRGELMISTIDTRFKLEQLEAAEITAFNKDVTFTYEGVEYTACLYWDGYDGYEIKWPNEIEPEWASNWEGAESIGYILDSMTPVEGVKF